MMKLVEPGSRAHSDVRREGTLLGAGPTASAAIETHRERRVGKSPPDTPTDSLASFDVPGVPR